MTISGNALATDFTIEGSTTATLFSVTVATESYNIGDGIFNSGKLTVSNTALVDNGATEAAASIARAC